MPAKAMPKQQRRKKKTNRSDGRIPIARSRITRNQPARFKNFKDGVVVTHEEYFADVNTATVFAVNSWRLNPGNHILFPWLSKLALNYESYYFEAVTVKYVPACPTTTPGTLTLVVDFDAADPPPANKVQVKSYADAKTTQVYQPMGYVPRHEQMRKSKQYYVADILPTGVDVKTYDTGLLHAVMALGPATAVTAGELSISYRVRLITPQLNPLANNGTALVTSSNLISVAQIAGRLLGSSTSGYIANKSTIAEIPTQEALIPANFIYTGIPGLDPINAPYYAQLIRSVLGAGEYQKLDFVVTALKDSNLINMSNSGTTLFLAPVSGIFNIISDVVEYATSGTTLRQSFLLESDVATPFTYLPQVKFRTGMPATQYPDSISMSLAYGILSTVLPPIGYLGFEPLDKNHNDTQDWEDHYQAWSIATTSPTPSDPLGPANVLVGPIPCPYVLLTSDSFSLEPGDYWLQLEVAGPGASITSVTLGDVSPILPVVSSLDSASKTYLGRWHLTPVSTHTYTVAVVATSLNSVLVRLSHEPIDQVML